MSDATANPTTNLTNAASEFNDKQFFDWMRAQQHDQRLTQDMVDGANELLALMSTDELKQALQKINGWYDSQANASALPMSLSQRGVDLIAEFEGFRSAPYLDSVGVPTIGYGNTYYLNDGGSRTPVTLQDAAISKAQAHNLKQQVINADFAPAVNLMFADEIAKGAISQNQFDALVSLAYNIGVRGLKGSSVYRHIKSGNVTAAADAFMKWNKGRVNGRLTPIKGLTRRRQKERELFLA